MYDATGKVWAKGFLALTNSSPSFSGDLERLEELKEPQACLYVANHASWLDIPVICTVLSPVFKFIAKGELLKVPCIGKQLKGVSISCVCIDSYIIQYCAYCIFICFYCKMTGLIFFPK